MNPETILKTTFPPLDTWKKNHDETLLYHSYKVDYEIKRISINNPNKICYNLERIVNFVQLFLQYIPNTVVTYFALGLQVKSKSYTFYQFFKAANFENIQFLSLTEKSTFTRPSFLQYSLSKINGIALASFIL